MGRLFPLHIQKKKLPAVLKKIHSLLKENGCFYLTLKEGIGEIFEPDLRYGDFKKFWSLYKEKELEELVQAAKFKILECSVVKKEAKYHTHPCVRIFCQKE